MSITRAELADSDYPVRDIILACVPKSRGVTSDALWAAYERTCKRLDVLPLWGQANTATHALIKAGRLIRSGATVRKA